MSDAGKDREIGTDRLGEIYSRTAAFYDQVAQPFQEQAKLAAISLLGRRRGERFLEASLGTGWVFSRIVRESGSEGAIATELAAGMLDVAARRLADECAIARPPFLLADLCAVPFADASFDCVLCTYTIEVLPGDVVLPALRELHRVLGRDGRLVLASLTLGEGEDSAASDEWLRRYARDLEAFGGARPISLRRDIEAAGLTTTRRFYSGGSGGWPTEIIEARPAP
jgi:ubiquinone/menaquinone biosynthesis C-methylase UbiE